MVGCYQEKQEEFSQSGLINAGECIKGIFIVFWGKGAIHEGFKTRKKSTYPDVSYHDNRDNG